MSVDAQIAARFADAGVRGQLHAIRLPAPANAGASAAPDGATTACEVALGADEVVVMASLYKLPVLVAFARAVDDALLDPAEPVSLLPALRTPGLTGIGAMRDAVTMSWRDLARSMITVSDDAAGDAILDAVGLEHVQQSVRALGLQRTRVLGGTRETYRQLVHDTGELEIQAAHARLADNERAADSAVFDPLLSSATTAREMTTLLAAIWSDAAASLAQCAFMREVLGQQIWPHRLASGFAYPGVAVAGKTGTLGALRHEVAVITHQHEAPIAVAVLTHAARADRHLPRVDAAIGATAYAAVTALR